MRRDVFQAISDPVRRDIIQLLSKQPLSVNRPHGRLPIGRNKRRKQADTRSCKTKTYFCAAVKKCNAFRPQIAIKTHHF